MCSIHISIMRILVQNTLNIPAPEFISLWSLEPKNNGEELNNEIVARKVLDESVGGCSADKMQKVL